MAVVTSRPVSPETPDCFAIAFGACSAVACIRWKIDRAVRGCCSDSLSNLRSMRFSSSSMSGHVGGMQPAITASADTRSGSAEAQAMAY